MKRVEGTETSNDVFLPRFKRFVTSFLDQKGQSRLKKNLSQKDRRKYVARDKQLFLMQN